MDGLEGELNVIFDDQDPPDLPEHSQGIASQQLSDSQQSHVSDSSLEPRPPLAAASSRQSEYRFGQFRFQWPLLFRQSLRDLAADQRLQQDFCREEAKPLLAQLELLLTSWDACHRISAELFPLAHCVWTPIAAAKSPSPMARYESALINFVHTYFEQEMRMGCQEAIFASLRSHAVILVPDDSRPLFTCLLLRSLFDVTLLAKADRLIASLASEMIYDQVITLPTSNSCNNLSQQLIPGGHSNG
jgi:hypothetical protein